MTNKDIKEEARKKLALNMHQAIVIYTVELTVLITLVALVVMSAVCLGLYTPAAIVMICYGAILGIIAFVACGMVNFAMIDFYLATYRCKPYNIRRLGETLARSGITKIFLISLKRTLIAFLLLLCLIVPGVIYLMRTSMANYLLIANPKMTASNALSASGKVMSGKKGAYFVLCMSLFGWYVLGLLTLGLGYVFIFPYTNLIKAVYYKRNLQGDKNVYTVPAQPISPQPMGAPQQAIPVQPQAPQAQFVADTPITPQQSAPIDSLEEEDVIDMNEAIREFGGQEPIIDIPEVPIAPPAAPKSVSAEQVSVEPVIPVIEPLSEDESTPVIEPMTSEPKEGHVIDGTAIVETERILSDEELNASQQAVQQAIDGIYNPNTPKKSRVNYFAPVKQSPDDFVTTEVDAFDMPFDPHPDNHVISDSELDEFLKSFDSETPTEPAKPTPAPQRPAAPSASRPERVPPRPSMGEHRTPPPRQGQTPAQNNETPSERAERIRREREERLKNKRS